jgi:hypothetical protein
VPPNSRRSGAGAGAGAGAGTGATAMAQRGIKSRRPDRLLLGRHKSFDVIDTLSWQAQKLQGMGGGGGAVALILPSAIVCWPISPCCAAANVGIGPGEEVAEGRMSRWLPWTKRSTGLSLAGHVESGPPPVPGHADFVQAPHALARFCSWPLWTLLVPLLPQVLTCCPRDAGSKAPTDCVWVVCCAIPQIGVNEQRDSLVLCVPSAPLIRPVPSAATMPMYCTCWLVIGMHVFWQRPRLNPGGERGDDTGTQLWKTALEGKSEL